MNQNLKKKAPRRISSEQSSEQEPLNKSFKRTENFKSNKKLIKNRSRATEFIKVANNGNPQGVIRTNDMKAEKCFVLFL